MELTSSLVSARTAGANARDAARTAREPRRKPLELLVDRMLTIVETVDEEEERGGRPFRILKSLRGVVPLFSSSVRGTLRRKDQELLQ